MRMLAVLALANGLLVLVSLMLGNFPISAIDALSTLIGHPPEQMASTVIWDLRLPRVLVAMSAGALLALCGAVLQALTRNNLADPSIVGVSQGAALFVVAGIVLWPDLAKDREPLLAVMGALSVAVAIQVLALRQRETAALRFILTGIGFSAFLSAITMALLTYGDVNSAIIALGWLAGSVHTAGWDDLSRTSLALAVFTPALLLLAPPLGALRLGHDVAIGLGVAIRQSYVCLTILAVAAAAVAVAAVGPVQFVGLIGPHIARRIAQAETGMHLLLSAACGALLVGAADLAGRTAFGSAQIPAGIVTALVGVPIFILLIVKPRGGNVL